MSDVLIKSIKNNRKPQIFWSEKLKSVKVTLEMNIVFPICAVSLSVGEKVTYPVQRRKSP